MHEQVTPAIVRNLLEVFNERDETKRLKVIQELYVSQGTFFEPESSFSGYEAINRRVTEVLQDLPANAFFRLAGAPTQNHDVARLSWTLETEDGAVLATGMDVARLEQGRLAGLYLFIDPSKAVTA